MNEHIKKLFDRALDQAVPETWTTLSHEQMTRLSSVFAELIIAECAQACMNEGASYEEKAAGAYQSNLYVTAIKKHFGVEEQSTETNELHTCPYAEEIHNDYETLCDCDEERTRQCASGGLI